MTIHTIQISEERAVTGDARIGGLGVVDVDINRTVGISDMDQLSLAISLKRGISLNPSLSLGIDDPP